MCRLRCFLLKKPLNQPLKNTIPVKTFLFSTIVTLSGQRLSNSSRTCRCIHFSEMFLPICLFSNIKACSRSSRTGYWAGWESLPLLDPLCRERILSISFCHFRSWIGRIPRSLHACLCISYHISTYYWYYRMFQLLPLSPVGRIPYPVINI